MHHTPRAKLQLRLVNLSFIVLFLVAVGLLQWMSREFHWQFDITQNRRYSLSPASIAAVERLKGPITVTAFASQQPEIRYPIRDLIGRYQQHKADITLEFVDLDSDPERVRAAGVQDDGELVIHYGDARENIPPRARNEESLTNAFTRLGHRGERWLVFLSGHGERSPDRQANFDLSTWSAQLNKRGFKTRSLALAETPRVPTNAAALVIASPRTRLLAGEVKAIEDYLARGGNVLWLSDPNESSGLDPVAESLGIEFQTGTIVDPDSEARTGNPAAMVVTRYGSHPIIREFSDTTVFPNAVPISVQASEGWKSQVLLDTSARAWSETGRLEGEISFDKGKDIPGPLAFGFAMTRTVEGREQRVVVVGDGDFLSNSIIGNGGNLELGMSVVNWLSRDDAYVNIPVRTARDRNLKLSPTAHDIIGGVFLLVLPLALIGSGVTIWWRRRKR
ncbi:MAG: GldG family protein [Gammaproteobacteria bacterium]|nr:GldG family protein [Gammaproteobacteria bacterium]